MQTVTTDKFKTGCFSINLLRPLCRGEAAINALIPSVLLRGTEQYPDIRAISTRLDDLYGATMGTLIRKKGEVQMTGFYADFIEDCFVPEGEAVFAPMVDFLRQVLCHPLLRNGSFTPEAVAGEKQNLINAIEARKNDKRSYANQLMLAQMCAGEAYGVPRLGLAEDLAQVTPESLYSHYRRLLATSRIEIFYLGRQPQQAVASAFREALKELPRSQTVPVGTEVVRTAAAPKSSQVAMDVTQGKLSIGLRTGCTVSDPQYPALLLLNVILGSGTTSKLFMNVREKLSLCYYANSSIEKFKGVMVISSGVEFADLDRAKDAILRELEDCRQGIISQEEMDAARRMVLSSLKATQDAPGRLDDFYLGMAVTEGNMLDLDELADAVERLRAEDVAAAARNVTLDTVLYIRGNQG